MAALLSGAIRLAIGRRLTLTRRIAKPVFLAAAATGAATIVATAFVLTLRLTLRRTKPVGAHQFRLTLTATSTTAVIAALFSRAIHRTTTNACAHTALAAFTR